MHRLDRSCITAPECLDDYEYRTHTWDNVVSEHKAQIRVRLIEMQGERCAYCEGPPYSNGHIEHFRRKTPSHFPELTFDWDNLFFACGSQKHCGHYKDRPGTGVYNSNQLIKPDVHDPEPLLYIHSTGEVRVRPHLEAADIVRARETIRVFNLNEPSLKENRRRAVRIYLSRNPDLLSDLMTFSPEEQKAFIDDEVQATSSDPYCTTIKHLFETVH